ncbi:putative deacetylase LmbE-like domain-containing protein [Kalaharituber pfeilii]|nr:putative deacetylase LmbE-like domain-containing protein [Kalaharituber pfeilii]
MEWLAILSIPLFISAIWLTALLYTTNPTASPSRYPTNSRILILVSHPDDEAMFFSPSLLHLTAPPLDNDLRVLCLSTGDADGLGSVRRHEILVSCAMLGVRNVSSDTKDGGAAGSVVVLDKEELRDEMGRVWPAQVVMQAVRDVTEGTWGGWTPEYIVTFDMYGVSGHSNHVSAWAGARNYIRSISSSPTTATETKIPKLYTLPTVSLPRKYLSILDFPFTYLFRKNGNGRRGASMLFISTWAEFGKARDAMTNAHRSQMRWFRWGWIWASRYMVMNELVEEEVLAVEMDQGGVGTAGKERMEKEL